VQRILCPNAISKKFDRRLTEAAATSAGMRRGQSSFAPRFDAECMPLSARPNRISGRRPRTEAIYKVRKLTEAHSDRAPDVSKTRPAASRQLGRGDVNDAGVPSSASDNLGGPTAGRSRWSDPCGGGRDPLQQSTSHRCCNRRRREKQLRETVEQHVRRQVEKIGLALGP
jgi:hypothetical protein